MLALGLGSLRATLAQPADAVRSLRDRELDFARSMANRDFSQFAAHLADDAVFINGGKPLRGKAVILGHWRRYYEGPKPPFSWTPEVVEVLDSGDLGITEGPVQSPDGRVIARFYTVWQRYRDSTWLVVFDNGYSIPSCPAP